ncbi:hypothetical protein H0H81_011876 [Sphagnurus paluster]|uniref:Uncharacterized protein n=1 Tax=Sphagnurus paluster TaxID=117069 RepID=A0A9P7FNN5_9AGAR|nr:hypothetical protein H0H81_011876 [Sphagnurus paluster]
MNAQPTAGPSALPQPPPRLSGTTPGLLDPTQPARLCRHPGSKLSFASFDPHTASSSRDVPLAGLSLNEQLYRPKRVVLETTPAGSTTWRFVPSARRDDGVPDEGTWPRIVDVCGNQYECTQEQWDFYKLDPVYECRVRAAPLVPIIIRVEEHPQVRPPSPVFGQKRRVLSESPAIGEEEAEGSGRATSPSKPRKRRPQVQVESGSDSEHDEGEVEHMIIDDQPKRPGASNGFAKQRREEHQAARKERQERMARRIDRLERQNGDPPETLTFSGAPPSSTAHAPAALPTVGKRKGTSSPQRYFEDNETRTDSDLSTVTSLFDSLRTNANGNSHDSNIHTHSSRASDSEEPPARNTTNYVPSTRDASKRTRTVSPGAARRNIAATRQAREKQKAEVRRKEQEVRRLAREAELLHELYRNNPDTQMPDAFQFQGTPDTGNGVPGGDNNKDGHGVHGYPPADETEVDTEAARLAAIAESKRKLAELEADRPLWEAAAAQRKEQELREAEELRQRAEAKRRAELEERLRREEEEAYNRAREEAARRHAEAEQRARREREKRERDSWAHGRWTVERARERYVNLAERFDKTRYSAGEAPLCAHDVPWPMLPRDFDLEDVTWQAVAEFFDAVKPTMKAVEFKKLIIKSHLRFHTDRWASRRLLDSVKDETERGCIEIGMCIVICVGAKSPSLYTVYSQQDGDTAADTHMGGRLW